MMKNLNLNLENAAHLKWVQALGTSDFVARYFSLGFGLPSLATANRAARCRWSRSITWRPASL